MKLVLTKDVAHVGKRFEEVEVSDGYGLNYLLPNKKAVRADSPEAGRIIAAQSANIQAEAENKAARQGVLETLAGSTVTVTSPANDLGTLFATIDSQQLAQSISESAGVEVRPDEVLPQAEIKKLGEHTADLVNQGEKVGEISVVVEAA